MKAFCKLFMAYAISTCVYAQVPISVEAFDEQGNNSGQLTLRLKLTNNTTDTLYNIHAKYFLNYERNRALNVSPYYMEGATATIDTLGDYLAVNIGITKLAPGVFPNASGISLGMNYTDYNSFNKSDNFSYPGNNGFTETEKIPVYYGDVLLAGISPGMLPDANPISLISGSELLLDSTKRVRFAWREVEGANSYRLTILSASDSNVLVQKETEKNRIDTALNEGSYYWRVESSEYSVGNGAWDNIVDFTKQTWNTLHTFFNNIIIDYINPLIDTPLAARKDTYLLDPKWGEMAIDREWDRPHWHHDHYDEEEHYRCWVVGAQMLNHFYGGNITQDEIKLNFKNTYTSNKPMFNDSALYGILGAFLHYNQGGADHDMLIINSMIPWVLNDYTILNRNDRSPTENEVKIWLNDSVPLYIWTFETEKNGSHVMIIDGYKKTNNNKFFVHIVNTDNDGHTAWSSLDSIGIRGFIAPQVTGEVRKTDSLIHWDHDEDGLKDYDEIFRFGTDPLNWDTDGDSIDDKTEIMSYTILEKITGKDRYSWKLGITDLSYADVNMNNTRKEHDFDSDSGGINDGAEDVNRNGLIEDGESNPFIPDDDYISINEYYLPDTLVVYALEDLRWNDGVRCFYNSKNCNVASASKKENFAVIIGCASKVNSIDTKGGVFLRSRSYVIGNIRFFTLPHKKLQLETQINVDYNRISFSVYESLWPYKIPELPPTPTIGNSIKEVFHNETYTLKDGDNFSTLRVHPGGKIMIEPGEITIGNIQLESGSRIQFTEPGKRTVIHANGSTIWRSWTLNDDLEQVAKGFMLVQHGNETMTIEGEWAGTIFAPNADLILGQSFKVLYGRFLGKNVTVHQYSTIYAVAYNPETIGQIVLIGENE